MQAMEALERAKEELKRADHQIFVSLKYTRTVDVLKNIIERLISAFNFGIEALLLHKKERNEVDKIPPQPIARMEIVKELYPPEPLHHFMVFFDLLRKISKATFERALEYRRHVTMTAHLNDKQIEITIDIINDYFEKTKDFIKYAESVLKGE